MASSKVLALDAGNSSLHFGWFDGLESLGQMRLLTSPVMTPTEMADHLRAADLGEVEQLVYCSVVPSLRPQIEGLAKVLGLPCAALDVPWLQSQGLQVASEGTGLDRLLTAWAAWKRYSKDVVVVDLGTATTFDVISAEGKFLGGAITAGLELGAKALAQSAEGLFEVPLEFPGEIIGKNTREALQSGILFGYSSLVQAMLEKIAASHGAPLFSVATGGLAPLLFSQTANLDVLAPGLTLEGLARFGMR